MHLGSKAFFPGKGHDAIDVTREHFRKLQPTSATVLFIDGGNAELLATPNFSLQLLRIAWTQFDGRQRTRLERSEALVEIKTTMAGTPRYTTGFPAGAPWTLSLDISAFDRTLSEGSHRVAPGRIGSMLRRFLEIETATKMAAENRNAVIVLDGTLEATMTGEQEQLDVLYRTAEKNSNSIAAVAKTSTLLTDYGAAFTQLLAQQAPEGSWAYHPVASIASEKHKAQMFFAKLHAAAQHIFRIDVHGSENALNALAATAGDAAFPGYPYGLVVADRFARVSNEETEVLREKEKLQRPELREALNAVNAHEILDSI